jgi:hypothetical protein
MEYNEIKILISEGNTLKAIKELIRLTIDYDNSVSAPIFLLSARLSELNKNSLLGIISNNEIVLEKNKINYALLEIIHQLNKEEETIYSTYNEICENLAINPLIDFNISEKGRMDYLKLNSYEKGEFIDYILEKNKCSIEKNLYIFNKIMIPIEKQVIVSQYLLDLLKQHDTDASILIRVIDAIWTINYIKIKDEPASTLYSFLNNKNEKIIERTLVALSNNCKNISDGLWEKICKRIDELEFSQSNLIIQGIIFFYGSVSLQKIEKVQAIKFLDFFIKYSKHDFKDIRQRIVWDLRKFLETNKLPINEHYRVIEFLSKQIKIDRLYTVENVGRILDMICGELPANLNQIYDEYKRDFLQKK